MSKVSELFVKYGVPVVILAGSVGAFVGLSLWNAGDGASEDSDKASTDETRYTVKVQEVRKVDDSLPVETHGTVHAAKRVPLRPKVRGSVERVSENFEKGEFVQKGEVLVELDDIPFRLAVDRRRSELQRARAQFEIERGRKDVAEREWSLHQKMQDQTNSAAEETQENANSTALATREPQTEIAKADVDAAQTGLEKAEWNLQHTTIRAPFDAYVATEAVNEEEFVSPEQPLASLVATDKVWVDAPIAVENLGHIAVPKVNSENGSDARIEYETGETTALYRGKVIRLLRDVNENSRMASIRIEVNDPFRSGIRSTESDASDGDLQQQFPLLLGSFVDVRLETLSDRPLLEIPREALYEDNRVFVFEPEADERLGSLESRKIEIRRSRPASVYVTDGISAGELVVISPLSEDTDGAKARLAPELANDDTTGR